MIHNFDNAGFMHSRQKQTLRSLLLEDPEGELDVIWAPVAKKGLWQINRMLLVEKEG